jgi:hypothetical protein
MSATVDRARLLSDLGYGHPQAAERAVAVLADAGLTNPRKSGISASKRERVRETLERTLIRLCARCAVRAPAIDREPVPVADPTRCERCGGSDNKLAVDRATAACRRRGVRRVVVVGGAPGVHRALSELWPADLDLRIVSGTDRHTGAQARTNLEWGDVVLIWATTELDHKVSELYTNARAKKVIVAKRRGIAALADRLAEHVDG